MMASYSSRVRADAARWVSSGLIDSKTADAIVADVDARDRRSLSFGSILAIMAALLLGAAILVFVASNWGQSHASRASACSLQSSSRAMWAARR
jgi:uncharacterized membrane protein